MRRLLPLLHEGVGERSSMTSASTQKCTADICLYKDIIVGSRPESVLSDVLAIHSIEMIPKIMILLKPNFFMVIISVDWC